MSNKKIGNGFEAEFCEKLFQNGYWVHNLAQNAAGQPADVVAVKNGVPYLIDCKVCSGKVFSVSRIEDNQRMAMTLWRECLNGEGWFAVKFGENIYMITLSRLDSMVSKNLPEELFQRFALTFEEWLVADECNCIKCPHHREPYAGRIDVVQAQPHDYEPRICQESSYALLARKYTPDTNLV